MARPIHDLPDGGITADLADALARAGMVTVVDVLRAGADGVVARTGLPSGEAEAIVQAARAAQAAGDATEEEETMDEDPRGTTVRLVGSGAESPGPPEPPSDAMARGLALARRLQHTAELAHRARGRVKQADAKGRSKSRKQLKRLLSVLLDIERDALAAGATVALVEDCRSILAEADDHLLAFLEQGQPRKRHLKWLRKQTRHTRRRFEAMLRGDSPLD